MLPHTHLVIVDEAQLAAGRHKYVLLVPVTLAEQQIEDSTQLDLGVVDIGREHIDHKVLWDVRLACLLCIRRRVRGREAQWRTC